jgi:hypothetical protein
MSDLVRQGKVRHLGICEAIGEVKFRDTHGSLLTRRWRKADSNFWSHLERRCGRGET